MHFWTLVVGLAVQSPASGVLEGQVLGHDGPVAGVIVRAQRGDPWGDLEALHGYEALRSFVRRAPAAVELTASTRTRADGRFALSGLPAGPLLLWADAGASGQAVLLTEAGGSEPRVLRLGAAFSLEASTLARNGTELHPRAGVRVVVVHRTLPLVFASTTGKAGTVRLGHAPAGRYVALAAGDGLAPSQEAIERPEAPPAPEAREGPAVRMPPMYERRVVPVPGLITLVLFPACSLHGTVLERGRPVAGATVEVTHGDVVRVVRTDAAGRFELRQELVCSQATYAVRAAKGASVATDCLQMPGLAVPSCCSTSPDSKVGGDFHDCRLQLTLRPADGAVAREALHEGQECRCEAGEVLDELSPWGPE